MRILFIGKSHPFALVPLQTLMRSHDLIGVIEEPSKTVNGDWWGGLRRWLSQGKDRLMRRPSLNALARRQHLPYLRFRPGEGARLLELAQRLRPDLICVISLSQRLDPDVLAVPRYGAINLHPSWLPRYRGPYPWFWQYYTGESHIGMTVHRMEAVLDTGAIVRQTRFPLERGMDVAEAVRMGSSVGATLLLEAVNDVERGAATWISQPPTDAPYARRVSRTEPLIDWQAWDLERVWHVMRGTYPWLDAVPRPCGRWWRGHWKIGAMERSGACGIPGRVYRDVNGHYAAHREGKIHLELQTSIVGQWIMAVRRVVAARDAVVEPRETIASREEAVAERAG